MRPTFSIIFFTVLSGAGYGVLFFAGIALATGWPSLSATVVYVDIHPPVVTIHRQAMFATLLAVGGALAIAGLASSVAHLGKPLRAWRAFSQWRSSWLSREGVVATATFVPLLAALGVLVSGTPERYRVLLVVVGALLALCAATTVYCTARIYSSLRPIPAWHNAFVLPTYLLLGLHSGALWTLAIVLSWSATSNYSMCLGTIDMLILAPACGVLKWRYWRWLDRLSASDAGAATGLDRIGRTRTFEQPHTEQNYLTHEMGFVLARKHARKLRTIALLLVAASPLVLGVSLNWLVSGVVREWVIVCATMLGLLVERWLFFAEARHAVIAYYAR
jgi:DMSO reductase anchor subunit